jgi:hypothetical protein
MLRLFEPKTRTNGPNAPTTTRSLSGLPGGLRDALPRLNVGASNDPLEREADLAADRVMAGRGIADLSAVPVRVRRSAKTASVASPDAPASVRRARAMSGSPLETPIRQDMEHRFGQDFSQVRVHRDGPAAQSAADVEARAYALGDDIVFGAGQYAPTTSAGRRLLAHELAHVVQGRQGAGPKLRRSRLLDFKDKKEAHDPSKLTDAQIKATNEYKAFMDSSLVWQKVDKVTGDEALLACRLILRSMREGETVIWETEARTFMERARKQLGTVQRAEADVGTLQWVPFNSAAAAKDPSKLESEFGKWLLAGGPEPDKATGKVNCWEMVMFSAYKAGQASKARLQAIYDEGVAQVKAGTRTSIGDTFEAMLRQGKEQIFDPVNPKSPEPLPGDIVIFDRAAGHAAVSLGTKDAAGRHNIVSHWPPPDGSYKSKVTTIEALLGAGAGTPVKFWSPGW